MTMGEYSLSTYEVPSAKFWVWFGMVFMAASYVFFMFMSCVALEFHRFESPENVVLDIDSASKTSDSYALTQTPRSTPKQSQVEVSIDHAREKNVAPVTVAFKDLWYTVPDPANPKNTIDLLKGISGYALPGTITALMGSSGAGKTTLMDVIAGRKTGGKIPRRNSAERPSRHGPGNSSLHWVLRTDGHPLGVIDDPRGADLQCVLAPGCRHSG
ncbi:hypothetical protein PF007_g29517 [Phytophthora fragariae]|nr:hypothetical protein PF007_g29517 [Phytophthora fragariae]